MRSGYAVSEKKNDVAERHIDAQKKLDLIEGYKEMSRINLSLAECAVQSDNEALTLGEQKLAECE